MSARPLRLLLDGHSTHNQPEVVRLAREKKVIILCLPPHATHKAQPLDCGERLLMIFFNQTLAWLLPSSILMPYFQRLG